MTSDRNSARLFAELVDEDGVSNGVNEDGLVEDLLPCFPTLLAEVDALKVCGAYGQQTAWLQRRKWLRLLEPVSAGRVHVHDLMVARVGHAEVAKVNRSFDWIFVQPLFQCLEVL